MNDEFCSVSKKRLEIVPSIKSRQYLFNLPHRVGERPETNPCLPHYQKDQNPDKKIWNKLFSEMFEKNIFPETIGPKRSLVSLPTSRAIFMKPGTKFEHSLIDAEFAHLHGEDDGSLHIVLSDIDAKELIDKSWGELHLLAGESGLPLGLVMVYAPRNDEEVNTVINILKASYNFCRGEELI